MERVLMLVCQDESSGDEHAMLYLPCDRASILADRRNLMEARVMSYTNQWPWIERLWIEETVY